MTPPGAAPSVRPARTLLTATLSIVLGALPIFMVGAMAVFIRPELGFGESGLGALATVYYLASALTTVPGGRLAEHLGGSRAMALGATLALVTAVGIALFATSWATLAILLVIAGVGNGIAFPSSNLAMSRGFPVHRQGVGFAIKQSAGPYATVLAGAAVPLIGLTIGWRWAFALMAVATLPIVAGWWHRVDIAPRRPRGPGPVPKRALWILAAGAFFGVNGTASLGAFYVESTVSGGLDPARAGAFLAIGSAIGICFRLVWGWIGDRHPHWHVTMLTTLLVVGSGMFLIFGRVQGVVPTFLISVVVFSTAWAWPSLLGFAVVTRVPDAPGIASGILGAGQFGGGILGPLTFGLLAEHSSYRTAWTFAGGMVLAAAVTIFVGGRALERTATPGRSTR